MAATPEEAEASSAVRSLIAAGYHERLAAWIARSASEPPRWQQASMMTDVTLLATPAELTELKEAISALLAPLVQRAEQTPSRNSRRRPVTFIGVAFPDE